MIASFIILLVVALCLAVLAEGIAGCDDDDSDDPTGTAPVTLHPSVPQVRMANAVAYNRQ